MSYDIIKNIKIDKKAGKVRLHYAASNVYPRHYHNEENHALSQMLVNGGVEYLEKELLRQYWMGCFQYGANDYVKALDLFRYRNPSITWDNVGYGSQKVGDQKYHDQGAIIEYTEAEVVDMLWLSLCDYRARTKTKTALLWGGRWITKITPSKIWFTSTASNAKVFESKEDAQIFAMGMGRYCRQTEVVEI